MSVRSNLAEELAIADQQSDYIAVELLWNVLVKAAHSHNDCKEYKRIQSLVEGIEKGEATYLMNHVAIDTLLKLEPPLETILVDSNEQLNTKQTAEELRAIEANRFTNPRKALDALVFVLKRIRNKRVHGFKSPNGPRMARFSVRLALYCLRFVMRSSSDISEVTQTFPLLFGRKLLSLVP